MSEGTEPTEAGVPNNDRQLDLSELNPEQRKRFLLDLRAVLYNYAYARGISAEEVRELAQACGFTRFSLEAFNAVTEEIDRRF